jgi:hypothetical protein
MTPNAGRFADPISHVVRVVVSPLGDGTARVELDGQALGDLPIDRLVGNGANAPTAAGLLSVRIDELDASPHFVVTLNGVALLDNDRAPAAAVPTPITIGTVDTFANPLSAPTPQPTDSERDTQQFDEPQLNPADQPGQPEAPSPDGWAQPQAGPNFVGGPSGRNTAAVIIASVVGVLGVLVIGVIAATAMLGNKIESSFNAIVISNTLPLDPVAAPLDAPVPTLPVAVDPSGIPTDQTPPGTLALTDTERQALDAYILGWGGNPDTARPCMQDAYPGINTVELQLNTTTVVWAATRCMPDVALARYNEAGAGQFSPCVQQATIAWWSSLTLEQVKALDTANGGAVVADISSEGAAQIAAACPNG